MLGALGIILSSMSSVTIRLAKVADLQAVIDVERRADARFAAHGLAAVLEAPQAGVGDRLPAQTDGRLFVAEDESGCVVGFAQVDLVDDEPHIEQVSIDPDAAGHRIGAHLMGTCEEWARAHRHNRITLCTYRDVPWNGPYYEELGWVALAEDKCGPQLQGLRIRERELGLEIQPRQAMVKDLILASSGRSEAGALVGR